MALGNGLPVRLLLVGVGAASCTAPNGANIRLQTIDHDQGQLGRMTTTKHF